MGCREEVLADNPTAYFPFEGNSLTTNLGSRSGVTLNSSGGLTWGAGKYDAAPNLSGSSSHAFYNPNVHDYFNSGVWTLELWFKRADTTTGGYLELFNTYDTGSRNSLTLYGSQGDQRLALWYNFKGGSRTKIIGPVVNDTNWHHVVATSDGTSTRMYLDGAQVGTPGTSQAADFESGTRLMLGAYETFANTENWIGQIDEFALYKGTALSAARVAVHYNPPMPAPVVTLSGLSGLLTLAGLEGPTVVVVDAASEASTLLSGSAGVLTLMESGARITKGNPVVVAKEMLSGYANVLTFTELDASLVLIEPVPVDQTGEWFFEVVMADKFLNASNSTASLETGHAQKRVRTELKTLVKAN